jgi:hypothetical protein
MRLPNKLPITRIEDYHTHYLGQVSDGRLFWVYETFAFTKPYAQIQGDDWRKFRKEYAVLHTFDKDGNYLQTKHWSSNDSFNPALTSSKLEELVEGLGEVEYKDIQAKLFQTTIDGVIFGLVPDEETESIELQPSSTIAFHEPWDGEYDT